MAAPDTPGKIVAAVVHSINDSTLLFRQNYTLTEFRPDHHSDRTLINNGVSAPSDVGQTSMLNEVGQDTLRGYNVNTIAIQVPKKDLALHNDAAGNPVIGVWSSTEQQSLIL